MGFIINNQIWQLAEKLYIHCYEINGFIDFLKSHEVNLPDNFYNGFEVYSFMSSERNDFAQFMQNVPSYRYIPILEGIVFNEKVKNTQKDNWNYYGTYIKTWYPELLKQFKETGLSIDDSKNKIILIEAETEKSIDNLDFLQCNFNDQLLNYIKKEINEGYNSGHFLAVMVLSRKLAECLIVRVFEVVFRKQDENGVYNGNNHSLWFDTTKKRIHDFDTLLENLKDNSSAFHEDKDFVEELYSKIKPFKNEANRVIHRDYVIPNKDSVSKWEVPILFDKLGKLYRKYCNP